MEPRLKRSREFSSRTMSRFDHLKAAQTDDLWSVRLSLIHSSRLQHKVLRCCSPAAGRGGFSVHTETVLWRWRTSANVPEDCSRWSERQRWNFVCRVPLLFSARPGARWKFKTGRHSEDRSRRATNHRRILTRPVLIVATGLEFATRPRISTYCRTETSSAREIRRRNADVLQICRTGASDTVKYKKRSFKLYSLKHRQPL